MVNSFYSASSTATETTWQYWTDSTNATGSPTYTTSDIAWDRWANTSTSSSTSTDVWPIWTSNTATTTSSDAWIVWNSTTTTSGLNATTWSTWSDQPVRALREGRSRVRSPRTFVDVSAAKERADKLLVEHLSAEQEQSLAQHGYFDMGTLVDGKNRRFRIYNNKYQHNVFEIDENGRKLREYCAHTSHACPQSDHALAQKLILEHSPSEFLRVANIWDLEGGRRVQVRG